MRPVLMCDKSALQTLPRRLWNELKCWFDVCIPPSLVAEIYGTLGKDDPKRDPHRTVQELASRCIGRGCELQADYRCVLQLSLLGHDVPMQGRPFEVLGYERHRGLHETCGDANKNSMAMLRNWSRGIFLESDLDNAKKYRHERAKFDVEDLERVVSPAHCTVEDANEFAKASLARPCAQYRLLQHAILAAGAPKTVESGIQLRWQRERPTWLRDFSQYAYFVVKNSLMGAHLFARGMLEKQQSSVMDMHYFAYTPFCHVFTSRDHIHKRVAHVAMYKGVGFIDHDDLQAELEEMCPKDATSEAGKMPIVAASQPREDGIIASIWRHYAGCLPRRAG